MRAPLPLRVFLICVSPAYAVVYTSAYNYTQDASGSRSSMEDACLQYSSKKGSFYQLLSQEPWTHDEDDAGTVAFQVEVSAEECPEGMLCFTDWAAQRISAMDWGAVAFGEIGTGIDGGPSDAKYLFWRAKNDEDVKVRDAAEKMLIETQGLAESLNAYYLAGAAGANPNANDFTKSRVLPKRGSEATRWPVDSPQIGANYRGSTSCRFCPPKRDGVGAIFYTANQTVMDEYTAAFNSINSNEAS